MFSLSISRQVSRENIHGRALVPDTAAMTAGVGLRIGPDQCKELPDDSLDEANTVNNNIGLNGSDRPAETTFQQRDVSRAVRGGCLIPPDAPGGSGRPAGQGRGSREATRPIPSVITTTANGCLRTCPRTVRIARSLSPAAFCQSRRNSPSIREPALSARPVTPDLRCPSKLSTLRLGPAISSCDVARPTS